MAAPIPATEDDTHVPATGGAFGKKGIGWAIFEFARNPYYNVIVIYIFSAYFASVVIGDEVEGQAIITDTIKIAGIILAVIAPIIGLIVDKGGGKKGFLFTTLLVLGICTLCLGFITPTLPGAVPIGMALLIVGYGAYTISELLHNALLPGSGRPDALPTISGMGLLLGNFAGVTLLVILAVANETVPAVKETAGGIGVYSGPIVAVWLVLFIAPFFIMVPEHKGKYGKWSTAITKTFGDGNFRLWTNIPVLKYLLGLFINPVLFIYEKFKTTPNVMKYLLARMIYADGIAILFVLGGVYVKGVLEYSVTEVAIYGIVGSLFGSLGGILGSRLDKWLGPKVALISELTVISFLLLVQVSITSTEIFFGMVDGTQIVHNGPFFSTLSELSYLLLVIPAGIFIVACISSSRYMLVHLVQPKRVGEFYGLYAMSGSVTVWMAPILVGYLTREFNSQRIGMGGVGILFFIGLALLFTVRADKTPEHLKDNPTY